jgi:hypothetical protein
MLAWMEPKAITREQAQILVEQVRRQLCYLRRLQERMVKAGMQNDPLFAVVSKAYDAIHELSVKLHYRTCKSGVG